MAKKVMHLIWLLAVMLVPVICDAQLLPPPPTPPPPPPPGVPITEGLFVLLAAGAFYGFKKSKK